MRGYAIVVEKPNIVKIQPHSRFLKSFDKHLTERLMSGFSQQDSLKARYTNFYFFSKHISILKLSNTRDTLCLITEDYLLLYLTLRTQSNFIITDLSSLKNHSICDIVIRDNVVLIGCILII